jgi:hypothetical protein
MNDPETKEPIGWTIWFRRLEAMKWRELSISKLRRIIAILEEKE